MGFLTTFTIYNDGVDLLLDEKNAIEFAHKLYSHASGLDVESDDVSLGNFANFCRAQKPRHADDTTIYVHIGNTVVCMDPYEVSYKPLGINSQLKTTEPEKKIQSLYKRNKNFFKKILEVLVKDTKELINCIEPEDLKELVLSDSGICPDKKLPDNFHQELLLKSFDNEENETLKQYLKRFN